MRKGANCNHFTGKKKPFRTQKRIKKIKEKRVHLNKYSNGKE